MRSRTNRATPDTAAQTPAIKQELPDDYHGRYTPGLKADTVPASLPTSQARTITVTLGRECFQPLQFNTVEVGPISVTAAMVEGETIAAAYMRLRAALTPLFQTEYELKLQDFLERRRQMRTTVEKPA